MTTASLLTAREAAQMLGISYATVKQWILKGKLTTVTTPGGHHRIAYQTLEPFLKAVPQDEPRSRERFRRVSGRNQIVGKLISVRVDGLMAEVLVSFGSQQLTSIITADAVRELNLKKGDTVAAIVKSTHVMIERLD